MTGEEGKVNGKYPIFNDLLCFLWCKLKLCPKDVLVTVIPQYYKADDVMKARDVLFAAVPPADGEPRRQRHRKVEEALGTMYNLLQNLSADEAPVFAALNLNNVPYVELKSVDGAALMWQQGSLKDQLSEVRNEQIAMKEQLAAIMQVVERCAQRENEEPMPYKEALTSNQQKQQAGDSGGSANQLQRRDIGAAAERPTAPTRRMGAIPKLTSVTPRGDGEGRAQPPRAAETPASRPPRGHVSDEEGFHRRMNGEERRAERRRAEEQRGWWRHGGPPERQQDQYRERYIHRREGANNRPPLVTGMKQGTRLRALPVTQRVKIFVSRFLPDTTVEEIKEFLLDLTGSICEVQPVETRYDTYASFVITADARHEEIIMDPYEWQSGILIRPFRGRFRPAPPPPRPGQRVLTRRDEASDGGRQDQRGEMNEMQRADGAAAQASQANQNETTHTVDIVDDSVADGGSPN